jgi:hypothetical protein
MCRSVTQNIMPTGYTACVENGASFDEFLWGCARGMGACVTMRDDPSDAPIPERFEPTDYHTNKLAAIKKQLDELASLTDAECAKRSLQKFTEHNQRYADFIEKRKGIAKKYRLMIEQAEAWNPPTADHVGLKEMMLQQLNLCYKDEADTSYYESQIWTAPLDGDEWKRQTETKLVKELAYHTEEHNKEVTRVESRNKWVQALRESVPPPTTKVGS